MGERVEEIKRILKSIFPSLNNDKNFEVTSKPDSTYNCIAWACNYKERWIQPPYLGKPDLDCVVWWPPDLEEDLHPDCLVKFFTMQGYSLCETSEHEDGFRKIALYFKEDTNEWTHAARQLSNGYWTSKLGSEYDIQHGTPESIINDSYGSVYCILKMRHH